MSIAGGSVIRYRFKNARESEGAALTFAGAGLAVEALEGARRRSACGPTARRHRTGSTQRNSQLADSRLRVTVG